MNIILLAGTLVAGIGIAVLQANPRRSANQAFALVSLIGTVWLTIVYCQRNALNTIPWMRANAIISSFIPWSIVTVQISLVRSTESRLQLLRRSSPWLIIAFVMAPLCLATSFVGS